jgi:hypothetical protein
LQRIHVGANPDGAAGRRSLEHRHHAGFADAGAKRNAELGEKSSDHFRGLVLLEGELGMLVQRFSELHQLGRQALGDAGDALIDVHELELLE